MMGKWDELQGSTFPMNKSCNRIWKQSFKEFLKGRTSLTHHFEMYVLAKIKKNLERHRLKLFRRYNLVKFKRWEYGTEEGGIYPTFYEEER